MNIDFELYRIFYVVANHSNISKASEELIYLSLQLVNQLKI